MDLGVEILMMFGDKSGLEAESVVMHEATILEQMRKSSK